jgi:hypothetical protein
MLEQKIKVKKRSKFVKEKQQMREKRLISLLLAITALLHLEKCA